MEIESIYKNYFQKSKMFLYPLLDLKRGAPAVPDETYLSWENCYSSEDMKFICKYKNRRDAEFLNYEKSVLLNHQRLIDRKKTVDYIVYVFDFADIKSDWMNFINGFYSKLSKKSKEKILNYFDKYSGNYVYMNSYLYPNKYFHMYAEILQVDVKILKDVGELCDKPNMQKETLDLIILDKTKILK